MIERSERERVMIALMGAFVIHALIFVGIQLFHPKQAQLPTAALPVFVELNALPPLGAPAIDTSSAPAPQKPLEKPSTTLTTPSKASGSATTLAAPPEYDPLAGPPTPNQSQPQPSPQPTFVPAPTGPTASETAQMNKQQQKLKQWQESHPEESGGVTNSVHSTATAQGPTKNSADSTLQQAIENTMKSVQNASVESEANAKSTSPANSAAKTNSVAAVEGSRSASTSSESAPAPGYGDSRIRFANGQVRGLISQGRLSLSEAVVQSILSQYPNHPPRIIVPVQFDVGSDGFITNLKLIRSSGYTQLDQEIENLFNGQVFVASPGAPTAHGTIDYVIQTR